MNMLRQRNLAALFVASSAVIFIGCGGEPETPPQPWAPASASATPAPAPTPSATAPVVTGPTPCDSVMSLAMTTAIQGRAAAEAPGMQPEGASVCGVVTEGASAMSETLLLQPGHCYTAIAQAMPNVTEVDVQVEADPTAGGLVNPALAGFLKGPPLMIGNGSGVLDTAGGKTNCYTWPMPFPIAVKVNVKARTGAGPVAAQLYGKKK